MKVLVDTHVLLWILRGERLLTRAALRALDEAENCCYSIVSLWEIATKVSIGKLPLPSDWCDEFSSTLASHGYQRISAEQLQVIVGAVSSPRARTWENCCTLLMWASEHWPEAADAILEMMRSQKAHVRFAALCSLGSKTPQVVVDQALRNGLADRSSRVRWKAADQANALSCRHLIPDITTALSSEKNPQTKSSIAFSLGFLRDGYVIKPVENGKFSIAVRLRTGGTGVTVTATELETKGIDLIVSEVRERSDRNRGSSYSKELIRSHTPPDTSCE